MIGEKTDGSQHHSRCQIFRFHSAQVIQNVGLQPRLSRSATAALIDQNMICPAQRYRNQLAHFLQLSHIVAGIRHRYRNTVRGANDLRILLHNCWNGLQRLSHSIDRRLDECRMVEEDTEFVYCRRTRANFALRPRNIFSILAAS